MPRPQAKGRVGRGQYLLLLASPSRALNSRGFTACVQDLKKPLQLHGLRSKHIVP